MTPDQLRVAESKEQPMTSDEYPKPAMQAPGWMTIEITELDRLRKIESDARAAGLIDEKGEVVKVPRPLPITADRCIVINDAVYHPILGELYPWKDCKMIWRAKTWDWDYKKTPLLSDCYSTREAAEAARNKEAAQ
jgi:hypothetical protein